MTVLGGCGSGNAANKENGDVQKEASSSGNVSRGDNAAGGIREIKHAMGKTEIEGTPQRIVTLYQGATDVAVALGVKPVGAVESWAQQPMYDYLKEELADTVILGSEAQPNVEEIAKLKPDLIIASKLRNEKIYENLKAIAPTVTHETVFQFKETVELMGQALNKESEAAELLQAWDARVADFTGKISAKLSGEWPVTVSILNYRADHARIYVTGYAANILNELGFIRTEYQQKEADEGKVVISLTDKEAIPSMNAGTIFYFKGGFGEDEAVNKSYEEWTTHPLFQQLDAVKNNRVFQVDEIAWNLGGGISNANVMLDQLYEHYGLEK
ncbi:ABC transporter substrate-binding protein [Paenibacillus chungangensis]|uniref:ABC transporter substrate-binding protein n=1 Tax=Paenibacillus chungangensis TaxID=696535 RepID=A0ABW3HT73_9BACL